MTSMRTTLFSAAFAFAAAMATATSADAQDAGAFDKWLSPDSPTCVPIADVKAVSEVVDLTPDQFQFVRAFYVAIPPVSRALPPGDHAIVARAGGEVMLALVADGQACARFLAPDFILAMVIEVGEGRTGHIGTPASWPQLD